MHVALAEFSVPTEITITSPAVTAIVPEQVDPEGLVQRVKACTKLAGFLPVTVIVWDPVLAEFSASPG
jgi:hypothetical protein